MKCPECKAKLPKQAEFCPKCSHQLTDAEKTKSNKKKKVLWFILGPILAIVLLFFVLFFWFGFIYSSYEMVDVDIAYDNVRYDAPIPAEISLSASGMLSETFEIPVYIDGELSHTFNIEYSGGKLGEVVLLKDTADVTSDVSTKPGNHTIEAEGISNTFNVLTAPKFEIQSTADATFYLCNEPIDISYMISNKGETGGEYSYEVTLDAVKIEEKTQSVPGKDKIPMETKITSSKPGEHILKIGDQSFLLNFYESAPGETGKLMDTTIQGYSLFEFRNKSERDLVCYVLEVDNEETAVGACYVAAGDKYELRSFPHGDYYVVMQYGDNYIPELHTFYENTTTLAYTATVEANVVNGAGFYTVMITEVNQDDLDEYGFDLGYSPIIPEQE